MRGVLRRGARILAIPTLALGFVLAFVPGRSELAVRVYALVLCAVTLGFLVEELRRAYPREKHLRPTSTRTAEGRPVPTTLARLEQEVILGAAGSFDLHHRLRPRLRAISADLLATRRAIDLDRESELAHQALGDTAWDVVRRDRPPPADRLARGIAIRDLDRVVESLEGL